MPKAPRVHSEIGNYRIPSGDLPGRIERDQERLRAEREQWLAIEQAKYCLPRRARLIDEMPA